jgi:hypothetical protein
MVVRVEKGGMMSFKNLANRIYKRMFKTVGMAYPDPEFTNQDDWFQHRTWTTYQQDEFAAWAKAECRKAGMSAKKATLEVAMIVMLYGWKIDDTEAGYLCHKCATRLGGKWPKGHRATQHNGVCPECRTEAGLVSVGDYDWPKGSREPAVSGGRD